MSKRFNLLILVFLPAILALAGATARGQTVWYVDDSSTNGLNDGSSWTDAFTELQSALAVAQAGDEIRVAQGIYRPDFDVNSNGHTGDREATFQLLDGVRLYGGYAGFGAPVPDSRDIAANVTILSGDLNGDDGPDWANNDENSYHVATASGTDDTAVLDGFTIRGGYDERDDPDGTGGGMYNSNGHPSLANCTFSRNSAEHLGGGMYNSYSHPNLSDCTFSENRALGVTYGGSGAGMYNHYSNPTLTACVFLSNSASASVVGSLGGAMCNRYSNPHLIDCTLSSNHADYGAGIGNYDHSNPVLVGCTFSSNTYVYSGGALYDDGLSEPRLTRCTLSGNAGGSRGGAIYHVSGGTLTAVDCNFVENSARQTGGAVDNRGPNGRFVNCTFVGNTVAGSPAPCGGGMFNQSAGTVLVGCAFVANSAEDSGGGIYVAGVLQSGLVNCVFVGNTALANGGGLYDETSMLHLASCILWGNSDGDGNGETAQISGGAVSINYSCVQGWSGVLGGAGNIGSPPLFVDSLGPDGTFGTADDNLRLSPDSPCIDAGTNGAVPPDTFDLNSNGDTDEPIPFDLDGKRSICG